MSGECLGWVYRHSPAKGATFTVHLAIGDSANDQHGYELWMRQGWLADKARVSRKTAGESLAWLVEHGLLELLESGKARGSANRYRFLMPPIAPSWSPSGGTTPGDTGVEPVVVPGPTTGDTGVPPGVTHNASTNATDQRKGERAALPGLSLDDSFEQFWTAYPRKTAKGSARKAWPAAVKAAESPEQIIAGAARYAADPNRDDRYTAHASTWLRAERWGDEPEPPRAGRAPAQRIDTNRDTESGRLEL